MPRRKSDIFNDNAVPKKIVRRGRMQLFQIPIPSISETSGMALTCGQGDMGQLGLGLKIEERKRPTLIESIPNVVEVCAGGMHNLCLTKSGEIYSFGCNDEGALGRDTTQEEGSEFTPEIVPLPGKSVRISAGDSHSACLLKDGRVFAWGSFRDSHGNMGLTLEGNKRVPVDVLPGIESCDIASGADHLVILTTTGKVYTVGCGEQGQLGRVSIRSASGESRRGKNELLQPGLVPIRNRKYIEAIWATTYCTFLRERNTSIIWAFGLNNYKQLAYSKDLQVVINPIDTKFNDVSSIAGGQHHTLVLKNDGSVYVIGRKDYGRLGLGNVSDDVNELQRIKSLDGKNIVSISCGEAQSFAITKDGQLYSWGMGSNHQLGTGSEDDALTPTLIVSKQTQGKCIIKAAGGGQHSIFLVSDSEKTTLLQSESIQSTSDSSKPEEIKVNGEVVNDEEKLTNPEVAATASGEAQKKGRKKK